MIALAPVIILSSALTGTLAVNLHSLVSMDDVMTHEAEIIAEAFDAIGASWRAYRMDNHVKTWTCDATMDSSNNLTESCERVITDFGYPPSDSWETELFPSYGFMPRTPEGATWSYFVDDDAEHHVCLSVDASEEMLRIAKRARSYFVDGSLFIGDECGLSADEPINPTSATQMVISYSLSENDIL